MMTNWNGTRALIIGAARQGQALARYLASAGAEVTINDRQSAETLKPVMDSFNDLPVQWVTGGHPLELLETAQVVCLSGGVPLDLPIVKAALERGLPLTNDTQVFLEEVSCKVIGITGSAGKTTTTTLVGRMAAAAVKSPAKSVVGGNIGLPLISMLAELNANDLAVMEVSSFQLEQTTLAPQIAAVLNITPNHLDRHGTMEAYTAAKARILEFQKPGDIAILNREDSGSWNLRHLVRGRLISFGLNKPSADLDGTYEADGMLYMQENGQSRELFATRLISLRGKHNLVSVLAACAIASAVDFPAEAMQAGVEGFLGVAHRLEMVREVNGIKWYNDSIATAPERSMAGIRAFSEPIVLLAGGRDKKLPWDEFARLVHQRVKHLVTFGEAAKMIAHAVEMETGAGQLEKIIVCNNLESAIKAAAELAVPGDVVLLSPGGTSYDEFKDFEERGEVYRQWVLQLS